MCEYHKDSVYIMANWTDELFHLYVKYYIKRHSPTEPEEPINIVSDTTLFNQLGIKVEKRGKE